MREPTVHDLKLNAKWFPDVLSGAKPFEVRGDDRGYRVGDVLVLREFTGYSGEWVDGLYRMEPHYTGRACRRAVTFILRHEDFPEGIAPGYFVLGLAKEGVE